MNGHLHIAVILCVKVLQRKKFLLKSERIPWICIISYSRKLQQIPEARETTTTAYQRMDFPGSLQKYPNIVY